MVAASLFDGVASTLRPARDSPAGGIPAGGPGGPAACRAWPGKYHGIAFPESQLSQTLDVSPDGSLGAVRPPGTIRDAIFAGRGKPDQAHIQIPVLDLFDDPAGRRHRDDLIQGARRARVIDLPGDNLYIAASHAEVVVHAVLQGAGVAAVWVGVVPERAAK